MDKDKLFDLLVVAFIVVAGLFTAYITFGILKSQAEAQLQKYSVGGAIAGALISWSLLASVYLQIRKSSQELSTLRNRNQELQQKLIRGAPRPVGFEIEVAEAHRIVLARPRDWERRGGIIFDFELPNELLRKDDRLPARFTCSYNPITKDTDSRAQYYADFRQSSMNSPFVRAPVIELIYLGGEPRSIESLKVIGRQFVTITETKDNTTGRVTRDWSPISSEEFKAAPVDESAKDADKVNLDQPSSNTGASSQEEANSATASQAPPTQTVTTWNAEVLRMIVVSYHEECRSIFTFDFVDDAEDFATSSGLFNQILTSTRFLV
jgi:hypothetical protein